MWGLCRHLFKQLRLEDLVWVTAAAEGLQLLPVRQGITNVAAGVLERALVILAPAECDSRDCAARVAAASS